MWVRESVDNIELQIVTLQYFQYQQYQRRLRYNSDPTFVTAMTGPGFIPLIMEALFFQLFSVIDQWIKLDPYARMKPSGATFWLAIISSATGPTLATAEVVKARRDANLDLQSICYVKGKGMLEEVEEIEDEERRIICWFFIRAISDASRTSPRWRNDRHKSLISFQRLPR